MTDLNIPLLRKAVEWVEEQDKLDIKVREWMQNIVIVPESVRISTYGHEQGCGTAYCVAGYVAQLTDERFRVGVHTGDAINVAQAALGLSDYCVDNGCSGLFQANNTAEDIRRIAEDIAGEAL